MKITTKDIIKILPLDENMRKTLLEEFDSMDPDRKYNLEKIMWDTYYTMYKLKLEENIQLALLKAKDNQEKLDEDFYSRVREQTEKEMQSEEVQKTQSADLDSARKAMELIVKEIQASKKQ